MGRAGNSLLAVGDGEAIQARARDGREGQARRAGCQFLPGTRNRNSSTLARPYIWRLRNFSRLTWPSVCPLLHGNVNAARTAAKSFFNLEAKLRISGALHLDRRLSHRSNSRTPSSTREASDLAPAAAHTSPHGSAEYPATHASQQVNSAPWCSWSCVHPVNQ